MIYEIERDDPAKPLIIKECAEESVPEHASQIVKELFQLQFLTNERRLLCISSEGNRYEIGHSGGRFTMLLWLDPEELKA